jgi:hypothetical protein
VLAPAASIRRRDVALVQPTLGTPEGCPTAATSGGHYVPPVHLALSAARSTAAPRRYTAEMRRAFVTSDGAGKAGTDEFESGP